MAKKVYLISGHPPQGGLPFIDQQCLNESENKNVLVLNLTTSDRDKLASKERALKDYFMQLGATRVKFLSPDTSDSASRELFKRAGLLYLPGGDTITLMDNIGTKGLDSLISSFNGIIEGHSAGAYVLCPEYLKISEENIQLIPTLGLVPFHVKAHYEEKLDHSLEELSYGRVIYALQNGSALIVHEENLEFVGNIWKFYEGRKEKV